MSGSRKDAGACVSIILSGNINKVNKINTISSPSIIFNHIFEGKSRIKGKQVKKRKIQHVYKNESHSNLLCALAELVSKDKQWNIMEMMNSVSLEDFSRSIMCDSPKRAMSDDIETSSSCSETTQIPLMRYPEHIHDHKKLSWMIKDNTPVESLMSKPFPELNQYLNQYFQLISHQRSPFSLVQVYPNFLNLRANRRYQAGEKVIEIGGEWCLAKDQFEKTRICKYLRKLTCFIQEHIDIFTSHEKSAQVRNSIYSCLRFLGILYIFQLNFVLDICSATQESSPSEFAQSLFFKLLPKSFDLQPFYHKRLVKRYHKEIESSLQTQDVYRRMIFNMLRSIVNGQGIKPQYQFKQYLFQTESNGQAFYEKYQRCLTFDNYLWATLCERKRIYHKSHLSECQQKNTVETFIPILDLFHNSYLKPNIAWDYDIFNNKITIYASRQIECGHLLSTSYGNFQSIEVSYSFFGIVDVGLECTFEVPYYLDPSVICTIIESHIGGKIEPSIKALIYEVTEASKKEQICLRFSSLQFENISIEQLLAQLTNHVLKNAINIAQNIHSVLWKPNVRNKYSRHGNWRNKTLFSICSLRKNSDVMKNISRGVKAAISSGIQIKNDLIDQIKDQLKKCQNFSTEYNLMCLHTILYRQRDLLRKVNESIFNINKCREMSIQ